MILLAIGIVVLLIGAAIRRAQPRPEPSAALVPTATQPIAVALPVVTPTWTPEPLLPTPTSPVSTLAPKTATATLHPTVTATPTATEPSAATTGSPLPTATAIPENIIPTPTNMAPATVAGALTDAEFARIGVGGPQSFARRAWDKGLRWSHSLDWVFERRDQLPTELTYWRTLRVAETGWAYFESWEEIYAEARKFPGQTWIIGNEPDVKWQDGVTPETYADRYHEAYTKIKAVDPNAQIAVAAVAAGTDLRLRYLDRVLATYAERYGEPMPVDVWTVHAYVLPEVRDSWGIDIPPGMTENEGDVYAIEDHDDLDLFMQQLRNFRRWMAENGYRDKPLAVTEFGILLPNDYGFPEEAVADYLRESMYLLLTASDAETGMPSDDNRLVQTMFWFILSNLQYPTGDLIDRETGELTLLGETMREFVGR